MKNLKWITFSVLIAWGAGAALAVDVGPGEWLHTSGVQGGLVVHVGCGDGRLTAALRANAGYVVHGIDTNEENVRTAREYVRSVGRYGPVSIDVFDGRHLPYVDRLVNLVVAENLGEVPIDEVLRVLAPRGVALIGDRKIVKDVPPEIDDWTHYMYDASGIGAGRDGAVSRPRAMQWKAGPEYSRSHENMSSVSAVVSAGGRLFSIMDEGPQASIYLPSRWYLSARDAFSGVLLWKVPVPTWHARLFPLKSGPLQLPRRLVATDNRVYATIGFDVPISELDAATGQVLRIFQETKHAEEILLEGDRLVVLANMQSAGTAYRGKTPAGRRGLEIDEETLNLDATRSIVVMDLETGRMAWNTEPEPIVSTTVATDGDKVAYLSGDQLVCRDFATGRRLWSQKIARKRLTSRTTGNPTLLIHDRVFYVANGGTLSAREAATGRELWSQPCAAGGYKAPASIFVVDDLIWDVNVGGEPYRPGTDLKTVNRFFVGYDLRTGDIRKKIPVSSERGYGIMHHRCHIPRASGSNIITSFPGIEFFDVGTGQVTHDSWIRGACLYGFLPANGMIYAPPHPCACYLQGKLTGFWAVAGKRSRPALDGNQADRLREGPAFETGSISGAAAASDWPTYRGNVARGGTTTVAVPTNVRTVWQVELGGTLSQSVFADGRLFVASAHNHAVHALDVASGKKLWSYSAGGRVDSAPTVNGATILFGSRDGYVYCLRADTGELVWRFRAAWTDQRCVAYDQVESIWPVHGSVLVHDDVAWFCAGRSSFLDGGLLVWRVNPRTGEVLSMTRIDSLGSDEQQPPITPTIFARLDMEGAKNDVLSCDGRHVFLRHWAFDLNGKSVEQNVDHLFSPTGFLDVSWFRRTYWLFGRQYVSGAQGWARAGNARPSGRILALDNETIYGFGRDWYPGSPGNKHQMYLAGEKEIFFAARRSSGTDVQSKTAPAGSRGGRSQKPKAAAGPLKSATSYLWSAAGDLQVRGMVLAGSGEHKRLIVAGARGDWVSSPRAYEGKQGSVLRFLSAADGRLLAEHDLPDTPVFDGLSIAGGRLYVSTVDGRIICMGEK